jgi:hypothetical protein
LFTTGVKLFPRAVSGVANASFDTNMGDENAAVSVLLCIAVNSKMVAAVREKAICISIKYLLDDENCMLLNVEVGKHNKHISAQSLF